jgi:AcrR family transcriptional regulator
MVKPKKENSGSTAPRGRRAMQAEQTRREILDAARRLFAANGYAMTGLKDIAADAGVSIQTIYDSVGSKAELVRALNDLIDVEANVWEIAAAIPDTTDPVAVARVPAMVTRRIVEHCGDILRTCLDGARSDPDLASVLDEGGRRHRSGARSVAERLVALDAIADDLSVDDVTLTIATVADYRVALLLLDDHGRTIDAVEDWIADIIARSILRPGRSLLIAPNARNP